MRGGARPGSGRKRKPVTTHVLQGTYRPDRHGPRPVVTLPRPRAEPDPTAGGETFAGWANRVYDLTRAERELANLAQMALDLARHEGEPGSVRLQAMGRFAALVKDLKLPEGEAGTWHDTSKHQARTTSPSVI